MENAMASLAKALIGEYPSGTGNISGSYLRNPWSCGFKIDFGIFAHGFKWTEACALDPEEVFQNA